MDGVAYEIDVTARSMGAGATAAEVLALANAIDAAAMVTTPFDNAISAAKTSLATAASESAKAADELSAAEDKFKGLEREATRAAKAMEKAGAKGDAGAYVALARQANAAAQAVSAQASAVDRARASAAAAAGAEAKLAGALKTLEAQAKQSAAAQTAAGKAGKFNAAGFRESLMATQGLMSSTSPMIGRLGQLVQGLGSAGVAGAVIMAATAVIALGAAFVGAAVAAAKFAIANDKVAKARLDTITKKWSAGIKSLFTGIDTKPLLNALDRMASMFSENTAAGHALKTLISTIMNPLVAAIEYVQPYAHELWNGLVYGALQVAIMVVRARNAILRLIPKETREAISDLLGEFDGMSAAFLAGKLVFTAVAAVLAVVAVAFLAVGATITAVVGFFSGLIYAAVYAVGAVVDAVEWCADALANGFAIIGDWLSEIGSWFSDAFSGAVDAISGFASDAYQAASDFVAGIVQGITDGIGAVGEAAANLAQSALDAVTGALGISSPSKVMMRIGGYTTEGMVEGLDAGAEDVKSSMEHLVGMADLEPNEAQTGSAPGQGSSTTTTTNNRPEIHLTIYAQSDRAEDISKAVERTLVALFDGDALQLGGGEVPA